MMKKYVLSMVLLGCGIWVMVQPPLLEWKHNACWSNSFVWLMRNIRPLTEYIIDHRNEYKDNIFAKSYINLIDAMGKKGKILYQDEVGQFHVFAACPVLKQKPGEFGSLEDLAVEMNKRLGGTLKEFTGVQSKFFFGTKQPNNAIALQMMCQINKTTGELQPWFWLFDTDNTIIFLSDYLLCLNVSMPLRRLFKVQLEWDVSPYVDDALMARGLNYELIGMVMASGAHFNAYIKDQFEEKPKWYFCDDIAKKVEQVSSPPLQFDAKSNYVPRLLLYKRIKPDVEKSLQDLAGGLQQLSRDLMKG